MATRHEATTQRRSLIPAPVLQMLNENWMIEIDERERQLDAASTQLSAVPSLADSTVFYSLISANGQKERLKFSHKSYTWSTTPINDQARQTVTKIKLVWTTTLSAVRHSTCLLN